jgi:hypothetical protein
MAAPSEFTKALAGALAGALGGFVSALTLFPLDGPDPLGWSYARRLCASHTYGRSKSGFDGVFPRGPAAQRPFWRFSARTVLKTRLQSGSDEGVVAIVRSIVKRDGVLGALVAALALVAQPAAGLCESASCARVTNSL